MNKLLGKLFALSGSYCTSIGLLKLKGVYRRRDILTKCEVKRLGLLFSENYLKRNNVIIFT